MLTPAGHDQDALRAQIRAAASAPEGFGPRLAWIAATALRTFRYPWTYLVLLVYLLAMGILWSCILFLGAFLALGLMAAAAAMSSSAGIGLVIASYFAIAMLTAGWAASGYNAGLIRMLSPMIAGRTPDAIGFLGGAAFLGPRLLTIFCTALLLSGIPIWLLAKFLVELVVEYGWATITSPWNRTLQWWILEQVGVRVVAIGFTVAAMNVLLGPWQAVVGTRKINLFAALPVTIGLLARQLPVSLVVLGVVGGAHWGLRVWSATAPEWATFVQFAITPLCWMALLCLVAPAYEPEVAPVRPRRPAAQRRSAPAATPSGDGAVAPARRPANPVPGLMGPS